MCLFQLPVINLIQQILFTCIALDSLAWLTGTVRLIDCSFWQILEASPCRLLEGRHISESISEALKTNHPKVYVKFWSQLQTLLKKMLASTLSASSSKPAPISNKSGDAVKLKEHYKISLRSTEFSQLHAMHSLWTS